MTTLWVHPFNGIAGDMTLAALIHAGADVDAVRRGLEQLDVAGWELRVEPVSRHGIGARNVAVEQAEQNHHRTAADVLRIVGTSGLPERVVSRSCAVFEALAAAEGAIHEVAPSDVHFHEVGAVDAIVDVVGVCLALEDLDVDEIVVGPVALGNGMVKSAHGRIPNPAPATVRLLEGWPVKGLDTPIELTTPTGAALVAALATSAGPMPAMTIRATGFGAGDAEPDGFPNLLQVVLGDRAESGAAQRESLVLIETNVDDATGEILGHTVGRLIADGALDAWITPIIMKKSRPAHVISVLARPGDADDLAATLLNETGSLGCRRHAIDRESIERRMEEVVLDGHTIRLKVTAHRAKAEHDDVIAAAAALHLPAREVADRAEAAWRVR